MRPFHALVAALVVAALPLTASAKWPQPSAGESASGGPEIILSFDDGPDHRYTARILEILRERNIQAIFFWVGHRIDQSKKNADRRRAVATRAVLEGHLVGTHTVNHAHLCRLAPDEGAAELDQARAAYARLTGLPMVLFRAPYGDHCDRVVELLDERGLVHTHWDIDPHEWMDHDSQRVADDIIGRLRHLDGRAMVLMHDTKLVTANALIAVLDWIDAENDRRRKRGEATIRILDASDWVAERLDPDLRSFTTSLESWAAQLADTGRTLVPGYPARVVRHP